MGSSALTRLGRPPIVDDAPRSKFGRRLLHMGRKGGRTLQDPERKQAYNNNRVSHNRRAPGNVEPEEWISLLRLCDHACVSCGRQVHLEFDHIKPISLGGLNVIQNIQPLCRQCNMQKFNSEIDYRPAAVKHAIEAEYGLLPLKLRLYDMPVLGMLLRLLFVLHYFKWLSGGR